MYQYRFASDPRNLGKEIKLKKMGGGDNTKLDATIYIPARKGVCVCGERGV